MAKTKFSLEGAQKGATLATRNGRPARYVAVLKKSNPQFPLLVEVLTNPLAKKEDQVWSLENYTTNGEYLPPFQQDEDLFIITL
jgi:hypothetical protein